MSDQITKKVPGGIKIVPVEPEGVLEIKSKDLIEEPNIRKVKPGENTDAVEEVRAVWGRV